MSGATGLEDPARIRGDLEIARVPGWTFVFDRPPRRLHRLNATASAVFEALDGTIGTVALAHLLADGFGADPTQVERDVCAIVEEFRSEGLLVGSTGPDADPQPPVAGRWPPSSALLPTWRRLVTRGEGAILGPHRALAFRFRVVADDPEVVDGLHAILAPLAAADDADDTSEPGPVRTYRLRVPHDGRTTWDVVLDGERIHRAHARHLAVDHLLWHLNRMAVVTGTEDTIFHAAAATWQGGAVLLPGVSNAGKSTLVTGLVGHGLGYLSDEAVLLDRTNTLRPYPKSIDLDQGSWSVFPELTPAGAEHELHQARWHIPPDRVRAGAVAGPTPLRAIIAPRYEADAPPRLEPLPPQDAVAVLLEQAFHLGERPGALAQVTRLVESVPCHRLVSGDLGAAVALVRDVLDGW